MQQHTVDALRRRGIWMFSVVPACLAAWAAAIYAGRLDVVEGCRLSAINLMVVLAGFLLSPLFMKAARDERREAFVVYWFVVAAIFNVAWQIPLVLFRRWITTDQLTPAHALRFIAWWGYGFADSHYGRVDEWMVSEELWWFLAIVISVVGLRAVHAGERARGFLLMGLAGALQAYNASLYIVYDVVTGLRNVPDGSLTSQVLYWGFNPLWAACALVASVFSFGFVLHPRTEAAR